MVKKLFSMVILLAAALSFCAVSPAGQDSVVFASASYGSSKLELYARKVASEINRQRAAAGLDPVKFCDSLNEVAILRAKECAAKFDHVRPDGSLCFTALDEANVPYYDAGENIACGQKTPEDVMKAWMNSAEHKANILSEAFEYVGVGICYSGGTYYWTQFFTGGMLIDGEIVPYISGQPQKVVTPIGRSVRFEVKTVGSDLSYQWYYKMKGQSEWNLWTDHTSSVTYGTSADDWDGMCVRCRITDSKGMLLTSGYSVVTIVSAPVIKSQPKNVTAAVGLVVNFDVSAEGKGLKYQWYYKKRGNNDWTKWSGHTTASTSGTVTDSWHGMKVFCRVTDSNNIYTDSAAATVAIKPTIIITSQPANVRTAAGVTTKFEVKATGKGLSYQWYYKKASASSWCVWKIHAQPSVSVTANDTWNGMRVYCRITDSTGAFVNSESALVTLIPKTTIVRNPESVSAAVGKSVSFTVIAKGEGLTYQWYRKKSGASVWTIWNKCTKPTLTVITAKDWNGMQVRCKITDAANRSVYSLPATVALKSGITVKSGPSNTVAKAGETIRFSAVATGSKLSCQWYFKKAGTSVWKLWSGHTTPDTSATANATWDGMKVFCLFTDEYGNTASTGCATIYILPDE